MIDIDQNTSNKCACKGKRKCALCSPCATKYLDDIVSNSKTFIYCPKCQKSSFLTDKNLPSIKIFLENSCQTENIECFCSNDDKERESIVDGRKSGCRPRDYDNQSMYIHSLVIIASVSP